MKMANPTRTPFPLPPQSKYILYFTLCEFVRQNNINDKKNMLKLPSYPIILLY